MLDESLEDDVLVVEDAADDVSLEVDVEVDVDPGGEVAVLPPFESVL